MSNEDKQKSTKPTFKIPAVFKVKAESEEKAMEYIGRLQRSGFEMVMNYERETFKAIKGWKFRKEHGDV